MRKVFTVLTITVLLIAWASVTPFVVEQTQDIWTNWVNAQMEEETEPVELDPDKVAKGRIVFEKTAGDVGCAVCHGNFGMGDLATAPNVRGVDEVRIRGALEGAEEMEFLINVLTAEDIENLSQYLQFLAQFTPVEFQRRRGVFTEELIVVPPNTEIQLIVNNIDRSECTFTFDGVEVEAEVIGGRSAEDFIWTTPDANNAFTAFCAERPEDVVTLSVEEAEDDSASE